MGTNIDRGSTITTQLGLLYHDKETRDGEPVFSTNGMVNSFLLRTGTTSPDEIPKH